MTELFSTDDPHDQRIARGASGLLRTFNLAGVLTSADVHVADRLGVVAGEANDDVLLAAALAVRAVRHGSVCVDLAVVPDIGHGRSGVVDGDSAAPLVLPWPEPGRWLAQVEASPLVTAGVLRVDGGLLYLDRYWRQEGQVCADLLAREDQQAPAVDEAALTDRLLRVFPEDGYGEQRAAAGLAVRRWTTVLTGGPGTGKTTTVAGVLALFAEQEVARTGTAPRIALTAPTGKAAARLQAAVRAAAAAVLPDKDDRDRLGSLTASTMHRLLRSRPDNATRFRHHRGNRLPHDVIVVDETSMVSLTMMARLLEAVRPDARLLLVGDPDQLSSVEAGAVLADLVAGLRLRSGSSVADLRTTHRFGERIGTLAQALRDGDPDAAVARLREGGPEIELVDPDDDAAMAAVRADVVSAVLGMRRAAESGRAADAVDALERHRLLCAHREGPFGVRHWNRQVERWVADETGAVGYDEWYAGRPILVSANDYGLGLFNGDLGVTVRAHDGGLRVAIETGDGLRVFATTRMSEVQTVYAMTVHKSQGSQADTVTVLLPGEDSPLLTRELFYTAVTRAQSKVRVVGTEAAVRAAVTRRAQRASGLRHRLARAGG